MAKTCYELWSDPHFSLKFVVLVFGIFVHVMLIHPSHHSNDARIVNGYHYSFLTVITALIFASFWFETTRITDICLTSVALIKLVVSTGIYLQEYYILYFLDRVNKDDSKVDSEIVDYDYYIANSRVRFWLLLAMNVISTMLVVIDIVLRIVKK